MGELDRRHLFHPFTQHMTWEPLVIVEAEGCTLIDESGRRYIDGVSSLWANVHGHRRRELDDAVRKQLQRVAHSTLLGLSHPPAIELAARLVELAPPGLSRVFYSDSGSTAVEVALKLAFQVHRHRGHHARSQFLALTGAYHGDTLGAVSVGGIDLFHQLFQPLLFHTKRAAPELASLEAAFAAHGPELAACIVEPLIQGAAGMRLMPEGFLRRTRELCDEHGVLLIADEVATGFGRTGTMFACEHEDVRPDLLCLAKGLTGGYLPLAATLCTEEIFSCFIGSPAEQRTFFHGHTYTGNPLACAAALASLELFAKDHVLETVQRTASNLEELLRNAFAEHPHVREIRQRGLMAGIEIGPTKTTAYPPAQTMGARVCKRVRDYGVILRPLGDVIVLMPPLSISTGELVQLVAATARAIADECGAAA